MKKYLLLITIVLINYCAKSQTYASNYEKGYKEGFKEGYCYNKLPMSVCSYPVIIYPPIPKINESSDNYTQGYNRGFENGLSLKKSKDAVNEVDIILNQRITKFNEYIPQNPVGAMAFVGMKRQAKYDARRDWIQNRIEALKDLLYKIFNDQTLPNNTNEITIRSKIWKETVNYVKTIGGIDYADDYKFNSIQIRFNKIERNFYDSYNEIVSETLERETLVNSNPIVDTGSKSIVAMGKISFWTNINNASNLKLYIDGNYIGTFDSYFSDGKTVCGQEGTITAVKEAGEHNYLVKGEVGSNTLTWEGTFTIIAGNCTSRGIVLK